MPQAAPPQTFQIPEKPVQEGSRWRYHRPDSEAVADWFKTQPLDEGMRHEDFVAGVVLIPQSEKVKFTLEGRRQERYDDTWTPYMQVGTRIAYFHSLARTLDAISVIEAADVPLIDDRGSAYYNGNLEKGYWWHIVRVDANSAVRYLCCTMRVRLYARSTYLEGDRANPLLEGRSTKQVAGGADLHQLAKAQTSAIGRALGVAGILVLGTGVATAEDMQELAGPMGAVPSADDAQLPPSATSAVESPPVDPAAQLQELRARAIELQSKMQAETPGGWRTFAAWWTERAAEEGWSGINAVPLEGLKAVVAKMERCHAEALQRPPGEADVGGDSPNASTEVQA